MKKNQLILELKTVFIVSWFLDISLESKVDIKINIFPLVSLKIN